MLRRTFRPAGLTTDPPGPAIVRFAVPLVLTDALQQVYLLVDGIVVGNYLGAPGLAAVGAAQPVWYLLTAVLIGLATGFAIRIAQLKGAGRERDFAAICGPMAVVVLLWSAASTLTVLLAGPAVLRLMGVAPDVAGQAQEFLAVLSLGSVALFGGGALGAFLRGAGDARAALVLQAFGNAVNIVLAWLFVGPLGWGITGAAWATVIAASVAGAVGIVYAGVVHGLRPVWCGPVRALRDLHETLALGVPVAVQHLMLAAGIMVLVWIVSPFGTSLLAAVTVVGRLEQFTSMVFISLSAALTMFVAQNVGAGHRERIVEGLRATLRVTVALTVVVSLVTLVLAGPIAAVFTGDEAVRETTVLYIVITYPFFILYTAMVVLHGALNGVGRTVVPLVCTLLSFVVVRLPLSYGLREPFAVDGVIWAVVVGWAVGLAYSAVRARRDVVRAFGGTPDRVERTQEAAV